MIRFRHLSSIALLVAAALVAPATASAHGSVHIQQRDGTVKHYEHATLELRGDTLRVISPDRAGALIIRYAACTYLGGLRRCYPTELTLTQHGLHDIVLQRGTLYMNFSDDPHALPHSTKIVPPHGVLALMRTEHGTYIAINGRFDEVKL